MKRKQHLLLKYFHRNFNLLPTTFQLPNRDNKRLWYISLWLTVFHYQVVNNNYLKNTFDISTNGSLVLNTFNSNYWDKYEGYDLDKNGVGDVPYHPLSLFAVLTEKTPSSMLLYRSFMITLLDKSEKVLPSITPDNFIDNAPLMKSLPL